MSQAKFSGILHHLRALAVPKTMKQLSDAQLLERYLAGKDEGAFTIIVQRHARLVWAVCRNVLLNDEDAEDALQATFLVLATKGGSIKKAQSLASWLHGVAFRTAMIAKRSAAVRRVHEKVRGEMAERAQKSACSRVCPTNDIAGGDTAQSQAAWRELLGVVDAEVRRLPGKYSAPFILCCLEGRSGPEAARVLGWKQGTVDGRLSQARKLLGQRLVRRGIDLSLVLGGLAVSYRVAPAAGIVRLAVSVLQHADLLAAGETVSVRAIELALGVMKAMALTKVKIGGAVLLTVALLTSGAGLAAWQAVGGPTPGAAKPAAVKPVVEQRETPKQTEVEQPRVDSDGNPLPENALARMGSHAFNHGGGIFHIGISPDGGLLSITSVEIRLWNVNTRRELSLPDESRHGRAMLPPTPFFAGEKMLTVEQGLKDILLRDMKTGKELIRFNVVASRTGLAGADRYALSPDGNTLVVQTSESALNSTIRFCKVATGKVGDAIALKGKGDRLEFAFSGDSKTLIIMASDSVQVWDVAAQTPRIASPVNAADFGYGAAISYDGSLLATAPDEDNRVHLWETKSLTKLAPLLDQPKKTDYSDFSVLGLAFSPDTKYLAVSHNGGSGLVRLWDLASRKKIRQFQADASAVNEVVFFPDGKTLAGTDGGSVTLWDVVTGKRRDVGHSCGITGLAFSPDGKTLVTSAGGFDDSVRLWDSVSGRQTGQWSGHTSGIQGLAFSPGGKLVATSSRDKSIRLWDFTTGEEQRQLPVKKGWPTALVFSPDGKSLFAGGWQEGVRVWDVPTGNELGGTEFLPGRAVSQVAFTADGKMVAALDWLTKVILWDVATKKVQKEFGTTDEQLFCFSLSPDGKYLATAGQDAKVRIREIGTGRVVRTFDDQRPPGSNPMWFLSVAYSPDGRTLAVGHPDGTVRIWEMATGQERAKFDGHRNNVDRLAFSPDGAMLATGSTDRTVMVWDITGHRAARTEGQAPASAKTIIATWDALASQDAVKGYAAIKELLAAGSTAVAYLDQRLSPAAAVDEKRVAALMADLESDQFAKREKASRQLKELGERAQYALETALAGQPSLELRRRAEALLEMLELTRSPDRLRALRALEVLEHIGTPQAQTVLERLAQGDARVPFTQEAKASVLRLKQRGSR